MMEKDATPGDTQPNEIPVDWDLFTTEIQAVAGKKQTRLTLDRVLFYAWSAVLITAIAVLFWLLLAQNDLVERETEKLREQVAEAKKQIEDTRKTASEKVEELAKEEILKDAAVRSLFADLGDTLSKKVQQQRTELLGLNEELGNNLTASLSEAKSAREKDKLEQDGRIKEIKDLSESLKDKLAEKVDQSKLNSTLQPIQTELGKATGLLESTRKLLNDHIAFSTNRAREKDQALEAYAKTANLKIQLAALREELMRELRKKADKPQQ